MLSYFVDRLLFFYSVAVNLIFFWQYFSLSMGELAFITIYFVKSTFSGLKLFILAYSYFIFEVMFLNTIVMHRSEILVTKKLIKKINFKSLQIEIIR